MEIICCTNMLPNSAMSTITMTNRPARQVTDATPRFQPCLISRMTNGSTARARNNAITMSNTMYVILPYDVNTNQPR